ncbi:SSI family serine proteinase inhibitor [Streptomyces sp. NPDC002588]|uniref:SSI family serine proteinase inhibitor n=1 Tax=Streptomyces sp. NPDC002588 TaxID=3154419 RepID=UPI00331B94F1
MNRFFSTTPLWHALPAAAALLLATAGTAPARAAAQHSLPGNWLQLSVTRGTAQSADTRGTLLLCDPPQGHSHATEACAQLADVGGDPRALPAAGNTVCALVYAPVTARASGRWNGRPIEYAETFGNACELGARTGAVFALDDMETAMPGR